ncbi:hypothetical protein DM01DRAFT_1184652 [Hesseltinella vesiculosa]|uniref:Uncharacterized protein n=1 Tax=Hesseltinella vesiculosa TaxID=101127 RepID=A0A1X2GS18_9FUNG|nr:hypothetical protein DM01DRAFT_1184652 [Hesseltinella vesiculosa]
MEETLGYSNANVESKRLKVPMPFLLHLNFRREINKEKILIELLAVFIPNSSLWKPFKMTSYTRVDPIWLLSGVMASSMLQTLGTEKHRAADQRHNNHCLCMDLYRLGVFCKNAIEVKRVHGILAIQVIGFSVHFYILLASAPTVHIMLKIHVDQNEFIVEPIATHTEYLKNTASCQSSQTSPMLIKKQKKTKIFK